MAVVLIWQFQPTRVRNARRQLSDEVDLTSELQPTRVRDARHLELEI